MSNYIFEDMVQRIKTAKKEQSMTNNALSEKAGVPIGTLTKILGGETKEPQLPTILKIAKALSVSAEYIIYGDNNPITTTTPKAQTLITNYNKLNDSGQEYINEQMNYALSQDKYKKAETVKIFRAARSENNAPPEWIDVPVERINKLKNAPKTTEI